MQLNGSEIIIECLKEQGVDTVFGYPGGAILNLYDELYKHPEIRHVLTSHEQGASHAADGYARATGKVGVCFATSGPGATNLITGIATAFMDSVPLVAITANVGKSLLGKDSFQEVDITGVSMPVTKYSMIVKDITKLADAIRRAFRIAKSGRPGPVLVDVTKDVTGAKCNFKPAVPEVYNPADLPVSESELKTAVEMINKAKKPMIFIGGGTVTAGASEQVRELARRIEAPVCDSLMAQGVFPQDDDLYVGMLGMHGTKASNLLTYKCDLFIVLGARFSDRCVGSPKNFAKQAKILQIDIDPAEINKNVVVNACVTGDVSEVLKKILPELKEKHNDDWMAEVEANKNLASGKIDDTTMNGPYIIDQICKVTDGNALICTDVGQHQMWSAQHYCYTEPRKFLTSGGLGTMGFGLGASIGAKIGCPEKQVINVTGDGCFRMNMNEIITAVRNELPLIDIVINNHVLGMVHQWQELFYEKHFSATILNDQLDVVKVAEAMGANGYRVTDPKEFPVVLQQAIDSGKTCIIDCVIDSDEKVFPMIPAGKANNDVFDEEDLKKMQGN
ncbi:MAG: biosynthetic-type acetolactate synthase large subunit [Eubacterium sp.]|nr:biosynthetic-type acetolactate synthase large subunit [Eubacterium sp.]